MFTRKYQREPNPMKRIVAPIIRVLERESKAVIYGSNMDSLCAIVVL